MADDTVPPLPELDEEADLPARQDRHHDAEHDGVGSLHDVESGSGEEDCLPDLFAVDREEARELGVALDPLDGDERVID